MADEDDVRMVLEVFLLELLAPDDVLLLVFLGELAPATREWRALGKRGKVGVSFDVFLAKLLTFCKVLILLFLASLVPITGEHGFVRDRPVGVQIIDIHGVVEDGLVSARVPHDYARTLSISRLGEPVEVRVALDGGKRHGLALVELLGREVLEPTAVARLPAMGHAALATGRLVAATLAVGMCSSAGMYRYFGHVFTTMGPSLSVSPSRPEPAPPFPRGPSAHSDWTEAGIWLCPFISLV